MKTTITTLLIFSITTLNAQFAFKKYNKVVDQKKTGMSILIEDDTATFKDFNITAHRGGYSIDGDVLTLYYDTVNSQYCGEQNRYAEYVIEKNESELRIKHSNIDNQCPQLDSIVIGAWVAFGVQVSVSNISNNSGVSVYPNPATNTLHVEGKKSKLAFINIYSGESKVIKPGNNKDVSDLPRGVYYLESYGLVVLE